MASRRRSSRTFAAPWGRGVILTTCSVLALLAAMAVVMPLVIPQQAWWAAWIGPGVLAIVLGIVALFCVKGFTIRSGALWVRRAFWETRVPLDDLSGGWADPGAMRRSIRHGGNGGFMAYTGWFHNKKLGRYRAWVTDPARAVVLKIGPHTIVVSPDRPRAFLRALDLDPSGTNPDP